ncbi:MAG: TrmH family RNA methyltransferase [Parcubacteria group bacterium]|nr:TrmH family RNA methyltransferase [Parcubacteria group bacterium]
MRVVLDNIRSLHNVGSIFRTSDAVGVEKVYLCGITPAPVDRFGVLLSDFAKTALGAEKTVPYEKVSSTWRCIEKLKKEGFFIIAIEQALHAQNLFILKRMRLNLTHLVVVVGNEVKGVSKAVLDRADLTLEIPMVGKKESLNVAVAFGIAAYQLKMSSPT